MHSRTKLAPEVGIAPTSRLFQSRANLPQLFGEMVVLAGNAPASSGYQPGALLLSYGTVLADGDHLAEGVGNAPTSAMPILFSRQVQPAYICLPSKIGCQGWTRTNTVRFNKPSCYFDTTWQLAPPAGFPPASFRLEVGCLCVRPRRLCKTGQRGRSCTCDPLVPSQVRWLLRYTLMEIGGSEGTCTLSLPADNGLLL